MYLLMPNHFFKNTGPHNINYLLTSINLTNQNFSDAQINDIKDLSSSQNNEITFFHSKKYIDLAKFTKASYCLTTENLRSILPKTCKPIVSNKVLLHTAQITKIFYPESITDNFDINTLPNSVDLETIYKETHGLYGIYTKSLFKNKNRFGSKTLLIETSKVEGLDINDAEDLKILKAIMNYDKKK